MNNTSLKNWCVAFAMAVCAPMAAVASPSESALPQAQQANGKCTGTIVRPSMILAVRLWVIENLSLW